MPNWAERWPATSGDRLPVHLVLTPVGSENTGVAINGDRLIDRLARLAQAGAVDGGGVTRLAWSPALVEAAALVRGWAEQAGAHVRIDGAGNVIAELPGSNPGLPPLVTGSHLDTVVNGGYLDGAYGLVAGIEVLSSLKDGAGSLAHMLRVVAYANEEGVVGPAFTGSRAIAGRFEAAELDRIGPDGITLADHLTGAQIGPGRSVGTPVGLDAGDAQRQAGSRPSERAQKVLAGLKATQWDGPVAATIELHVEQGPVLDRTGPVIGVVTGIAGQQRGVITITGLANHAGTTPMAMRSDALLAAAEAILALRDLAVAGTADVATAGRIEAYPNVANVVPGRCRLTLDIRAADLTRLQTAVGVMSARLTQIGEATRTTISVALEPLLPPTPTDARLQEMIGQSAGAHGLEWMEMVSGAGHDCANLSGLGPIAMIFVPSVGGVSHHPSEFTEPAHLVAGASVLLDVLVAADHQLKEPPH